MATSRRTPAALFWRAVAAIGGTLVAAGLVHYGVLCYSAGERVAPRDAWISAQSMLRAAWKRDEKQCSGQLERLRAAMALPPREDLLLSSGVAHNIALPAMTADVVSAPHGKHYVTLSRRDYLVDRDLAALERLGWEHVETYEGVNVFAKAGWMLHVNLDWSGDRCLTDVYAAVTRDDAPSRAER